ncbi:metalloregulator ArsR/SmtB family transcription factor [uncultured Ilyobacter sp.]|uniref:ArsR/SmtB family transcription factor n=1 Tax=uncultured Ilyobacter sp. TaxID=544433 RepID=UPI0029F53693|nr:metalloregulator ArsR/SmtB family transcription factor [uncultured Ilyobacter sp.]
MEIDKAVLLFKMMSNPIRLGILKELSENGVLCVSKLEEAIGSSQSSTSQHLAHLRNSGILTCQKNGKKVCYTIADKDVEQLIKRLELEEN